MTIRLLIADNEEFVLRLMHATFRDPAVYETYFAKTGAGALRLACECHPDVAILDANMPAGDGYEVCRQLKKIKETAETKVIILTGDTDDECRIRATEAGADGFLLKPFYPHTLRDLANRLMTESQIPPA